VGARFVTGFAVGIGIVWALAFASGVATHDYTPLGIVTPVMLIAAGAVFGIRGAPKGNGH
jgi:hypothetical protein